MKPSTKSKAWKKENEAWKKASNKGWNKENEAWKLRLGRRLQVRLGIRRMRLGN